MFDIAANVIVFAANEDWLNSDFAADVHVFAAKIPIRFHFYFSPNSRLNINVFAAIFGDEFYYITLTLSNEFEFAVKF